MDGSLRHVTFRVEHDCPMAELSRAVAQADFHCWSAHRIEVVEVRCTPIWWPRVVEVAERLLSPRRVFATPEGGVLVWEPKVEVERSISRTLESHGLLWLQPMRVEAGWEHYDAVALGGGEQDALKALSKNWKTQVARRKSIGPEGLLASLFLSLRPALEAPTRKQAEALVAAAKAGYYRSPRDVTTADVAAEMKLGRSAFEERLRGGENRLLGAIVPALEHYRLHEDADR